PNVINKDHFSLIPLDLIRKYQILPLGRDNGRIKVLVHDPNDLSLLDDLRFRLGADIDTALGARDKIKEYIDTVFSETRATIDEEVRKMTLDATIDRGASLDIQIKGEGDEEEGDAIDGQQAPIV